MELWPNNKFTFRIPYNDDAVKEYYNNINPGRIELVKTKKPVKDSVRALLAGIPDDEFVYWCFDDVYLYKVFKPGILDALHNHVQNAKDPKFDAIRLLIFREERLSGNGRVMISGLKFQQKKFNQVGFWFHQYIKCGVLRELFLNNGLPSDYTINLLGEHKQYWPSFSHKIFVPAQNLCILGETTRGKGRTINCTKSLDEYEIEYPYHETRNFILNNRIIKTTTNLNGVIKRFRVHPS